MREIRKTKIVCTLGPSTDKGDVLRQLMQEGMNVARFNFSHGSHEEQKARLDKLVALREELDLPVAALLDTKGPEIRLKELKGGKAELKEGQLFTLALGDFVGDASRVAITYEDLHNDVKAGDRILIDDGLIEMKVVHLDGTDIVCEVINGGMISNKKGVNVPNVELSMPFISETDYSDIVFGIKNGFDFIAASFTRTADDILQIRKILEEHDCKSVNIIAKIENKQGVDNIDDIIRVSDGIMVARGDMGVEIPLEEVPILQKKMIKMAEIAAGGKEELKKRPRTAFNHTTISPLRISHEACENAMIVAEAGLPNHILVMVQQGATSPISYAGSVAVHNADFLAFNTLLQCVNRGNPTLYGASACVMDMKKGLSLVAAPEVFVLNAAMARMSKYYNIPSYIAGG